MRRHRERRNGDSDSRSAPCSQDSPGRGRRLRVRLVVGGLLVSALAVLAGYWELARQSEPAREAAPPRTATSLELPEPPPPVPAAVLGLSTELPQTVATLKAEVLQVCQQLVDDLPQQPESHAVRALFLKRFGNTAEAVQCWRKCLELNSKFSPAYFGIGAVAAEKADYDGAVESLSQALKLNPDLAGAYTALTEACLQQGEAERALAVAREHVRRFPQSRESHYWLGQTYLELKRYEDAKQSHAVAIRIDPQLTPAYHSLAVACTALGERDQASVYRRQFATLKQTDMQQDRGRNKLYRDLAAQQEVAAGALLSAGNVYLRFREPRKAEACWLRGASLAAQETGCRESLVSLYETQDRPRAALRVTQELIGLTPQKAHVWADGGRLELRLNHLDKAAAAYRQSLACDPQYAAAYQGLVDVQLRGGHASDETLSLVEKAVALEPSAKSYLQLSAVRQDRGDRPGSIAAMEQALALEPTNSQLLQIYEQLKRQK